MQNDLVYFGLFNCQLDIIGLTKVVMDTVNSVLLTIYCLLLGFRNALTGVKFSANPTRALCRCAILNTVQTEFLLHNQTLKV